MKRWFIRLSVLSAAGILGFIAIARAQRSEDDTTTQPDGTEVSVADNESATSVTAVPAQTVDPFVRPVSTATPEFNNGGNSALRPSADFGDANPLRGNAPSAGAEIDTRPPTSIPANGARSDPYDSNSSGAESTGQRYPGLPARPADRYATPAAPPAGGYRDTIPAPGPAAPSPLQVASSGAADGYADPYGAPPTAPAAARFANPTETSAPPAGRGDYDRPNTDSLADAAPRRATPAGYSVPDSAAANASAIVSASDATGRPGGRQLEGPQSPNLVLQKTAPDEIQVGKPVTFDIAVRNTGNVTAHDVKVHDSIPAGTRLLGTKPNAQPDSGGGIVWSLGDLAPGDEKFVEVQLMPVTEGEVGSVASVTFRTEASVRTLATRPQLKIDASAPSQVMIGDQITVDITVSNLGTGAANDIVIFESLPSQLRHPSGSELEFDVGDLAPKESRKIKLTLTAARPGVIENAISARGDGSVAAEASVQFEVIAPELSVSISGPTRRYLERQATYTVQVANPGTAPAKDIELVSRLPRALKFVSANNAGHYDQQTHAVYWSLAELPEGEQGNVKLVALPVEPGEHTLRVESTAKQDLSDSSEETIHVEGLPALFFEVVDLEDPVEVGGDTVYEIRVLNQGTKTANNIVVAALIPAGMSALSADGPTRNQIQDSRVIFAPLPRLAPKADTTYTLRVQGVQPGDQRLRVQIQSDEMDTPVTKEESTRVYADR